MSTRLVQMIPAIALTLVAWFFPHTQSLARSPNLIFKVSDAVQFRLDELVEDIKKARIVVIGEQHDNRWHHQVQLRVIDALHQSGIKVAVGFEMFQKTAQVDLDHWVSGKMNEEDFFRVYSRSWDFNLWPLYRDIFIYAREHSLPMVGLNIPRSLVSQVAREGFGSLTVEERRKIGFLSCNVDDRYQKTLARVLGGKGHLGDLLFDHFCEAQVVWDTSMALSVIDFLEENEDTAIVVLAGNFHAWKRGIAEQIRQRADLESRVILPSEDTGFVNYEVVLKDADYVWWLE